jgi:hypothetical protein
LDGELSDFCAAHYNAPAIEIIRHAVRHFMTERLEAEPEMRRRYEEARRQRLQGDKKISVIEPKKG